MGDVKDIQKTNSLSSFLDTQGIKTSPFSNNTIVERAYGRAERIVAALFLLTNHFSHSEQLRSTLRKNGMELLSSVLSLRVGLRSSGADLVESAQALLRELISLVRMSAIAGYISMQNASEVIQALDELGSLLVISQRSVLSEAVVLTRDDLVPRVSEMVSSPKKEPRVLGRKGQDQNLYKTEASGTLQNKGTQMDIQKDNPHGGGSMGPNSTRSNEILDILRRNGRLGIKDICANMPGCSEKMVQRELANLTSKGHVKKSGEKRWSTYSMVE